MKDNQKDYLRQSNANPPRQTPVEVPTNENGSVGIRATLNNMGVDNNRIGYDESSGNVTLDGNFFMKPEWMDDNRGISYASEDAIRRQYARYQNQNKRDPAVKVSDYYTNMAGQYGLTADSLGYSNGTVTIGGVPVDYYYTDETGKAWAPASAVQNATMQYINSVGLQSPNDLLDQYNDQYLAPIQDMLYGLSHQRPFTYNPANDPVYAAYAQVYRTEGNRASQDAMANYAVNTGGYTNSAAATAGAMANQYYANLLASQIPTLAQQAYQRYSDQYNRQLNLTGTMLNLYKSAYQNAAAANTQTLENINNAAASNTERDRKEREARRQEVEQEQADKLFNLNYKKGNQEYYDMARAAEWLEVFNTQKKEENDLSNRLLDYETQMKQEESSLYPQILRTQLSEEEANAEYRRAMTANIRALLG